MAKVILESKEELEQAKKKTKGILSYRESGKRSPIVAKARTRTRKK